MSGIGFTEMLLLAVIALIVVGPHRLPGIARAAGKLSRQARNAWQGLHSELQSELDLDHNRKIMQASATQNSTEKNATSTPSDERESNADLKPATAAKNEDDRDATS